MDQGSLAPCVAHDLQGGFAKEDISAILKMLVDGGAFEWSFISDGLSKLGKILRFQDKKDLSTRLAGYYLTNESNFNLDN